ncbi:MAG TPA: vanadium-dependent haloperoxidase [Verrucomicrobiae bacterium]|nr:vanadium-dependent haloperoxidase [Verrucomicrobiae bacterium]
MKSTAIKIHHLIAIGLALAGVPGARADVVTDWNQITLATQVAVPGGVRTPPAARALAMVHLAIFDSLNAIDRRFTPYAVQALADPAASAEAAAAAAAHAVLLNIYPGRQADLDTAYAASLASIADGSAKAEGIVVGESVAAVILALRSSDGSAVSLLPGGACCQVEPYTLAPGPGIFQPDPTAVFVAWGKVTPFALRSGSQFRAEGPPGLSSPQYADDYNEVQSLGAINSLTRTPDQTEAALFWMPNIQIMCNDIARIASDAHHNDLWKNARLFALLNVALADTAIAVFDTKYTYNFWRPREAIHAGDTDGNEATVADPTWTPLAYIGGHPDYVSNHSALGGAAAQVLAHFFGTDDFSFSITTSTAPGGVYRSYTSFSQAAEENLNSRVWLGVHFRTACHHGLNQGKQVANFVVHHFLRPVKD